MIKCCQTQVENEYQVIESEIDRLNTEIQLKGSLIKELEMKVSRLEVSLGRLHKQLSAICVENTNVPQLSLVNKRECRRFQPVAHTVMLPLE